MVLCSIFSWKNRMASSKWFILLFCIMMLIKVNGFDVPITIVKDAVAKGAVCLDGSPPAYHLDKGFGVGSNSWLIHMQGGAWCNNASTCLSRSNTEYGSSKLMTKQYYFSGILSNQENYNPEFYKWNRVVVRYCDGSSYTGDVETVDPNNNLHYRGARVWRAIMDDLLSKGMNNADHAILTGCSAGALGAMLQCDNFRALLPCGAKVKCLSDAGFFIDVKDILGAPFMKDYFAGVVARHGSAKNLPASCVSHFSPGLCFFPQYAGRFIRTPLFLLNAAYDSWQIVNIFAPSSADPHNTWLDCKRSITKCSHSQLQTLHGFRQEFLGALSSLGNSPSRGWFINSCYAHCQSDGQETWLAKDSPSLDNTTISKAVGDWYYDRKPSRKIDCPYPCDKTCHNVVNQL